MLVQCKRNKKTLYYNPETLPSAGRPDSIRRPRGPFESCMGCPYATHGFICYDVAENFSCDGETRHDMESLTGAIDRFNGLDCSEKRLCVTKDEVSIVYPAIGHNGETQLDESWRGKSSCLSRLLSMSKFLQCVTVFVKSLLFPIPILYNLP